MKGRTIIVAGNGCSITQIEPGQVLASDAIIRINNFFFEPEYYLGQCVDLAFMGGDPRVARFMFETLHSCRSDYDLRSWSSQNAKVKGAGARRFKKLFQPMKYRDGHIRDNVAQRMIQFQKKPTTGVFAVLMAHALGAEKIILIGFDLYHGEQRYPFALGQNYCDLMGHDLQGRGIDNHLHDSNLDRAILRDIMGRNDVVLQATASQLALADIMPSAPIRAGKYIANKRRNSPPIDWVSNSGLYPISALKMMRKISAFFKQSHKRIMP